MYLRFKMYSFSKAGGCRPPHPPRLRRNHSPPSSHTLNWSSVPKGNSLDETLITFIYDLLENNERMMGSVGGDVEASTKHLLLNHILFM